MTSQDGSVDTILDALQERAKELSCLYRVNEICNRPQASLDEIFRDVIDILPPGWQYPTECLARITADGVVYEPPGLTGTPWVQVAPIRGSASRWFGETWREPRSSSRRRGPSEASR